MPTERHALKRIVIAGGSGFLGQSLIPELLPHIEEIVVLTRGTERSDGRVRYVCWDARTITDWSDTLDGADAIINLVGRTVDCRKTPANKTVILESRVDSVNALAAACKRVSNPPRIWIQSATAHIYGDTDDEILDDDSPTGTGFAPTVGTAWEAAFAQADLPNTRRVILRISFVMGDKGGALQTLGRLARSFLGGTVGSGRQYISWIHVADLNAIILRALTDDSMSGTYTVTAPNPVTNAQFMRVLRHVVGRPWSPPAPALAVRIASFFMRTDPELALLGRRIVPKRLLREGFRFQFPLLEPALRDLLIERD